MIRPHRLDESSAFLGQNCALCKQEFASGDEIVICPEDGSRHHVHCWEANNNHCTAYGCKGEGEVGVPRPVLGRPGPRRPARPQVIDQQPEPAARPRTTPPLPPPRSRPAAARPPAARPIPNAPGSKVRTLPAGGFGCWRTCLFLLIVTAILATALLCAGVWYLTSSVAGEVGSLPVVQSLFPGVGVLFTWALQIL